MRSGPPICALRARARRKSDSDYTGWPAPCVADSASTRNSTARWRKLPPTGVHAVDTLTDAVTLHGWPTPLASDLDGGRRKPDGKRGAMLREVLFGWGTPTSRDHKDGASIGTADVNGLLGRQVWAYAEMTASGGALSPAFHLWLQGYPPAWLSSGEAAMQSCRKSPRTSSVRARKSANTHPAGVQPQGQGCGPLY